MMTVGQKATHFGVIALGTLQAPLLKMLDDKQIEKALQTSQKYATALHYPMYMRTSIVIPLATGVPALVLGFVGDKVMPNLKESTQLYLLEYGAAATVGGLVQMITLMNERQKAGIPVINPNGQQARLQAQQQAVMMSAPAVAPAVASAGMSVRPLVVP